MIRFTETKRCQYPALQFLWTKILSKWPDNDRHWLYRPLLAHFRRNMAQLSLFIKIHTKQWFVLLKPNVANILLFNFCAQKFVQHGSITIAIASGPNPHHTVTRFRLFNVYQRVFCAPNEKILLVYILAKMKMCFIWKYVFFPKSASSKNQAQGHFPALFKRIHNHICSAIMVLSVCVELSDINLTWAMCYHSRSKH